MNHYLIRYRPPREDFATNATDTEKEIIGRHFAYLEKLLAAKTLVLAGRTDDAEVGIAVIKAVNDETAEAVLTNDPAVREGVFMGSVKPFRLALKG